MKVSVIMPFHNGIHFLQDALCSLAHQTFQDFEVILACNQIKKKEESELAKLLASYEGTLDIQRIETQAGVAKARNAALDVAKGEYVYFLDSDDYLNDDTLERQVQALENDDMVDFTISRWESTWFQRKVYMELEMGKNQEQTKDDTGEEEGSDGISTIEQTAQLRKLYLHPDFRWNVDTETLPEKERAKQQYQEGAAYLLICKRGGLKSISALGILISKAFIDKYSLRFDEDSYLYSDLAFVTRLIDTGAVGYYLMDAVYVKHRHNDPIHYPMINQLKDENRFHYYVNAYQRAKAHLSEHGVARFYLDEVLLNYYCRYYITRVRRSENDYWRKERFEIMHDLISECVPQVKKLYKGNEKRMIKAAVNSDIDLAKKCANRKLAWKKLINIFKNSHTFPRYLYYNFFTKKPVLEDTILFETFFGKSYSDSPKYIYEYIMKHYPGKYRCVWSVENKKVKVPYGAKRVRRYSIAYMYYLARAKYQVFNVRQPVGYRKNEGTVFLECWHGTPLKRLVFDQEEVCGADPRYKSRFYKHVQDWDYLISPNPFSTEKFQSAFRVAPENVVTCGYPRNDILYTRNTPEEIAKIKEKLGIPKDKKIILYAPTWRDDDYIESGHYNFQLQLDLKEMQKRLGNEYVVVLRMHYYIASNMDISAFQGFAYDESHYNDITELYLISDILITDYSSVFFDYGNLRRPMLFFTYDLEKYRDMLRGFYLDIEKDVPGPILYTSDEVIDAIEHIDTITEKYKERYDVFYERFCSVDDGHASERICTKVFGKPLQ